MGKILILTGVMLAVAAGVGVGGYYLMDKGLPEVIVVKVEPDHAAVPEVNLKKLKAVCGYCHAFPTPDAFPKFAWREELKRAYEFIRLSDMQLDYPSFESAVKYYEKEAPDQFAPLVQMERSKRPLPVAFKRQPYRIPDMGPHPGVTNVNLVNLFDAKKKDILVCHTRPGEIWAMKPYTQPPSWQLLGKAVAPAHAEVVDLDGDGHKDLIVADLGSLFPSDEKAGAVLWFPGDGKGGFREPITLLDGVGRVADVQAADFNNDGKIDLVVAVFGWRKTGEVIYLENHTTDWSKPKFVPTVIDPRSGTIHVPIIDLNGDGHPDFIALISQGTEEIMAYLNDGKGKFEPKLIWAAPHPGWGFSGIQLVDMDGDGLKDILFTNGDILDAPFLLKPYHGIQWLKNPGKGKDQRFPWDLRRVDGLYGAMNAVAADVDGDGDQDILAATFLPPERFPQRRPMKPGDPGLDALVLYEQIAPGKWDRHILESVTGDHLTVAAGDLLGDGKVHIVVGNFFLSPQQNQLTDTFTLWWNLGKTVAKEKEIGKDKK